MSLLLLIAREFLFLNGIKSKAAMSLTFDSHCKAIAALFFIIIKGMYIVVVSFTQVQWLIFGQESSDILKSGL